MRENREAAMQRILVYEGGKVDDPNDPGGRTNQGVTQRVFTAWLLSKGKPSRDVYTMTSAERDAVYSENYVNKVQFDALPPGVDFAVLDGAVNSGVTQSVKWLQRALGIHADGLAGVVTIQAAQQHPDHDVLIADMLERRRAFLRALKTFPRYGNGWLARVAKVQQVAQSWAMGSVGPVVNYVPGAEHKAVLADAKRAPGTASADVVASGGTMSTILTSAQDALLPMSNSPTVAKVLTGIMIAGVVLTVVGILWGMYSRKKRAERADVLDLVTEQFAYNGVVGLGTELRGRYGERF